MVAAARSDGKKPKRAKVTTRITEADEATGIPLETERVEEEL